MYAWQRNSAEQHLSVELVAGRKKKRLAILAVGSLVADGQSEIGIKNKTKQ